MTREILAAAVIVLAVMLLLTAAAEAQVTECQTSKGRAGNWSWREIDGKRCWYQGRGGKDKRSLTWSKDKAAPPVELPPPIEPPDPPWPAVPIEMPRLDFEGHWRCATRGC